MSETTLSRTSSEAEFRKKAVSQAYFWTPWLVIASLVALKLAI